MSRFGIDTSIFVRLLTGDPAADFEQTKQALQKILNKDSSAVILVSNLVIGEAYFVLQHHYKISKSESKRALISVLTSGLVQSLHGDAVIEALEVDGEPGLLDRLIAIDYHASEAPTLTHDRSMKRLPGVKLLDG